MADRGDTHYHVPNLNLWFLISSVLLTISVVWTVIDDWNAEWKNYQRDFVQVELALEQSKFAELERQGAVAEQERLQALVEAAQEQLDSKQAELKQAERAEYEAKERRFKAEQDVKGAKGDDSWARQLAEVRIIADDQVFENELDEMESRAAMTSKLQLIFEDADSEYQEAKDRTASIQSGVAAANEALAAGTADLRLITRRIDALDPQELDIKAADFIRDFPGLDFVDPKLKVQKYVLDDLTFELNFTKKTRIDMCTTCHMGVERTGFEDAPQPHTTHPRRRTPRARSAARSATAAQARPSPSSTPTTGPATRKRRRPGTTTITSTSSTTGTIPCWLRRTWRRAVCSATRPRWS